MKVTSSFVRFFCLISAHHKNNCNYTLVNELTRFFSLSIHTISVYFACYVAHLFGDGEFIWLIYFSLSISPL
jgi:hypothetical protein